MNNSGTTHRPDASSTAAGRNELFGSFKAVAVSRTFNELTKQHAKTIALAACVMIASTLAGLLGIEYQADLLAALKPVVTLAAPQGHTNTDTVASDPQNHIIALFALFTLFQLLFELLQFAKRGLQNRLAIGMAQSIKNKIFAKLLRFNNAELAAINQGNVNQLFTADAGQLASVWAEGILAFVTSLTLALGVSLVLFFKVGWPGFIFLVCLFALVYQAVQFSRESSPLLAARAFFSSERLALIQESFRSASIVKMLTLEGHFVTKITAASKNEAEQRLLATHVASKYMPFFASLRWIAWAMVLLWIVYGSGDASLPAAEKNVSLIFAVNWYSTLLQDAFLMIGAYLNFIQIGAVSASRLDAFFSSPTQEEQKPFTSRAKQLNAGETIVSFSDASFAYPANPHLQALCLTRFALKMGSFVGVVGRIGAGKSTFIRALAGEIEPARGSIWRASGLRAALVTQEPFLMSATLRDTIRFQFANSAHDDRKLHGLLADSQFNQDFGALSDGWDTVVGERGLMLSGGQKMRMSLARAAFFETADMILLDDPLSSLDQATAVKVTESLILGRWATKTRVLVTHFVDALQEADTILVFDGGKLIDQGTHAELLQRCNLFAEIKRQSEVAPNSP